MEVSNAVTPTQLALICILSSVLLVWTAISLWLALRPGKERQVQREEIRVPLVSAPIRPAATPTRQVITQVQLPTPSRVSDANREMALEHSQ